MKTLSELESILNTYQSGPIVHVAARELLAWVKAYRKLAIELQGDITQEFTGEFGKQSDLKDIEIVDKEAARMVEGKDGR